MLAAQQQQQQHPEKEGTSSQKSDSRSSGATSKAGTMLWRQFFSKGGCLADARELVAWIVVLQEHAVSASAAAACAGTPAGEPLGEQDAMHQQQHSCSVKEPNGGSWPGGKTADAAAADAQACGSLVNQCSRVLVRDVLQKQGMWPLDGGVEPSAVLAVCLRTALSSCTNNNVFVS